jgi:hypothetical protein
MEKTIDSLWKLADTDPNSRKIIQRLLTARVKTEAIVRIFTVFKALTRADTSYDTELKFPNIDKKDANAVVEKYFLRKEGLYFIYF